jgi:hypothetical protein
MELLRDDRLDALIGEEIAFRDAPVRLPDVFGGEAAGLAPVIRYD